MAKRTDRSVISKLAVGAGAPKLRTDKRHEDAALHDDTFEASVSLLSSTVIDDTLTQGSATSTITGLYTGDWRTFTPQTNTAGTQHLPDAAALTGGGYVIIWQDEQPQAGDASQTAIRGQAYDATGAKVGSEFLANTATLNGQREASVGGLTGGGFVVVWRDESLQGGDASSTSIKAQLFSAIGTKIGGEFLVNTTTFGYQGLPDIAPTPNGGFAVTWVSADANGAGVFAQFFTSAGAKIGVQFAINTTTAGAQDNPAVTVLSSGNMVVTWEDNSLSGGDASGYSIKGRIFSAAGTPLTGEFLVNTTTAGDQKASTVTALSNGNFVVTWQDSSGLGGGTAPSSLQAQIYDANGVKIGTEFSVNTQSSQGFASVTALSNGGFAVAFLSDAIGLIQIFDATGAKIGREFRIEGQGSSGTAPAIVALADDRLLVAGTDQAGSWGIEAQIFTPDPGPSDVYLQAHQDWLTRSNFVFENEVENGRIGYLSGTGALNTGFIYEIVGDTTNGAFGTQNGHLVVLDSSKLDAETSATATVRVRVTDDAGRSFEKDFTIQIRDAAHEFRYSIEPEAEVNSDALTYSPAASASPLEQGGYVVVWGGLDASGAGIKGQRYDASGGKAGGEFLVNTTTAGSQDMPQVAGLKNGDFVVVWAEGANSGDIKGQRFSADGDKLGGEFLATASVTGRQDEPEITALEDGNFVVTWRLYGTTASVIGQLFSASGSKIGTEFTVGLGSEASVIGLASGGFVVGYSHYTGSAWEAKLQRFDSSGSKLGEESVIATSYGVQLASLADGSFVAVTAAAEGLVAEHFSASGAKIGTYAVAPEDPNNFTSNFDVIGLESGGFVVTWEDSSWLRTRARVFTASGEPVTMTFAPNQEHYSYGSYTATIVPLAENDFVIIYPSGTTLTQAVVRVESSPPKAVADSLTATEDTVATFSIEQLLANDSDPDGEPLTLVSVGSATGGTAVLNNDGTITFTPTTNFAGDAHFTYVVTDGNATATGTTVVAVAGVNDSPVNGVPAEQYGSEDSALSFSSAKGNAITVVDVDSGQLTVTLFVANGKLTLSQTTGLSFSSGANDSATMTFTGTVAEINSALNGLSYRGNVNYEGSDTLTITTSDGMLSDTDTIAITLVDDGQIDGTSGSDTLQGSPDDDLFDLSDGGSDNVSGLGGNDGFYFGGALDAGDVVNGGAGDDDQIGLQGNYAGGVTLGGLSGVELVVLLSGSDTRFGDTANNLYDYNITTTDGTVGAGTHLIFQANTLGVGEDFTFNGSAETDGTFTVYGGFGVDNFTGGSGSAGDGFFFGQGRFGSTDVVNGGGSAMDQLGFQGNFAGANAVSFGAAQLTGIEFIVLLSAVDTRFGANGGTAAYDLTMHEGNVAAGQQMIISANNLKTGETMTFNGAAETNGSFRIFSGAGDDAITGSQNADEIYGGAGADVLTGNAGNDLIVGGLRGDTLTGGEGNDTFRYTSVEESNSTERDGIQDFNSGDLIDLSRIDANVLQAGDQAFSFIGNAAFSGNAGELRYENISLGGPIWIVQGDHDGDGVSDFEVVLVISPPDPITAGDFLL